MWIVGFCVDCWDLFKLWKFCIILVELENKFWIGKYIAEYTMMRQMKPQILFKPRHTEKWTHFCTNHDHHEDGGYRWLLVSTGEYRRVPVGTGVYWRALVGTSVRWLSLSITLLQTYIETNLDCYKLRLLQTNLDCYTENSRPKHANWEGVLYEDSVKDLLKIC